MQVAPQNNILLAYLSGMSATVALHYAKQWGYDVPPDIADALPFAFAVAIAHLYDALTTEKEAPPPQQQQVAQASMPMQQGGNNQNGNGQCQPGSHP